MPDKSSKQATSKELSANEKDLLRTPLEQELYGYAKKGQPVLLHGNDTGDRFDLLRMPHLTLHDGLSADGIFEYLLKEEIPKACIAPFVCRDYLIPEMRKAMEDGNHKRIFKLICSSRYPSYMLKRVDCENESGEAIFGKLTDDEEFTEAEVIDYINSIDSIGCVEVVDKPFYSNFERIFRLSPYTKEFVTKPSTLCFRYEGLLWNPGTLFVDNLRCVKDDFEDEKYYEKLASIIQEGRQLMGRKQVEWLVAYAYDYTTFPKRFLEQFKPVSLDSKDLQVTTKSNLNNDKKGKLKRGEKPKNIPDPEFIPFVMKNLLFLRSDSGGKLKGKELHEKMQQDIINRFDKYGNKATLKLGTIRNLISEIDTGKIDTKKK